MQLAIGSPSPSTPTWMTRRIDAIGSALSGPSFHELDGRDNLVGGLRSIAI
jgi:hypothetical protein